MTELVDGVVDDDMVDRVCNILGTSDWGDASMGDVCCAVLKAAGYSDLRDTASQAKMLKAQLRFARRHFIAELDELRNSLVNLLHESSEVYCVVCNKVTCAEAISIMAGRTFVCSEECLAEIDKARESLCKGLADD